MTEQVVKLEKNESIAIITLNRPKVLNALSREVQFTLNDYISEIEIDDSINCVIVTGAGEKAFSAGGDIHEMDKLSQMENPPQDHPTSRWYSWNLMNFKKPLIVMTPKSLLRHKNMKSPLKDFSDAGFQEFIDDNKINEEIKKDVKKDE